jgi:hypothetical protein
MTKTTASTHRTIPIPLPFPRLTGAAYRQRGSRQDAGVDFAETLDAIQGLIGRLVYVSVGHAADANPMTVAFSGLLQRAHEFSPEIVGYLDPTLTDQDVIVLKIGESTDPAWVFLVREKFERGWQEEKLIGFEAGGLRVSMFAIDDELTLPSEHRPGHPARDRSRSAVRRHRADRVP